MGHSPYHHIRLILPLQTNLINSPAMYETIDQAKLALSNAEKQQNCLKKADISELKAMSAPPQTVIKVVSAVYKMFNPEVRTSSIDWKVCKKMLADPNLLYRLVATKNLDKKAYDAVVEFTVDPELNIDAIRKNSAAAASFMIWVKAVMETYRIRRVIEGMEKATSLEQN